MLASLLVAASLVLPIHAHTQVELEEWLAQWKVQAVNELDAGMMEEWHDMRHRHRWFFEEEVIHPEPTDLHAVGFVVAPPSVNTGMGSNVEQWRGLVAAYFPADQVDHALRVMACESGGNPWAYNRSGASGLMQVLASWADNFGYQPSDLFDPDINLYVASLLYYDGGWGHWVCR